MSQAPTVAVVILNYNSASYTLRCVDSIRRCTADLQQVALLIVDNNSSPEDQHRLARLAQDGVQIILAPQNLGFSGGMMLGARSIAADYYFFLNNDCEFLNDVLAILAGFMQRNPRAALCSGSMCDVDGRMRSSFNYFPSLALTLLGSGWLRLWHPRRYPQRRRLPDQPLQVDVVSGAAMFVRATVLQALHGLDTGYFLYCEEEDFALRVQQAGWQTYCVPQAKIKHVGGASSSQAELRSALQREFYISFFRYLRLHHGTLYARVFRSVLALKILRRALTGKTEFGLVAFVLRGAPENQSLRYRQSAGALSGNQAQAQNAEHDQGKTAQPD